ncbi:MULTISPECIES: chemotaxis protein CheB [Calothrix]|uniref:protein-glutamate methylesterase n=2 Tax=Calothrix TaxID=1186 RepID=A0ABR8AJ50_9CYAN|nr:MULTISPECIES: chemotaxis protein CheB [Calothrix]MBD2200076.1 chemotaxis protein CheB [Calothrix parietina FACHB-288]MBD2229030.1 chemotaxis protein CheB [Calothrix anomala FACHB-343]
MVAKVVVIGASIGGLSALKILLKNMPKDLACPIIVVQHRHPDSRHRLRDILQENTALTIREVEDKDEILPGYVYLAPADYHLLVESGFFALSTDEPVSYARPSIDVLFESAADIYGEQVIGVILTGANEDGVQGLKMVKLKFGLAIVQDPKTAECAVMPKAAINAVAVDWILPLEEIAQKLIYLCHYTGKGSLSKCQ